MQWRFQLQGAIIFAIFCSALPLWADITLPSAAPSPPPQADEYALRISRGARATIPLRGHHSGSGTVTFWIVDPPLHGVLSELRPLGDNRATIIYQNDGAAPAAADRFSYLVQTSSKRVSSPAEVKILVEEPPPRLQAPARIEFDPIMAGDSQTRDLAITNSGGGVLEGRLTVSAPWRLRTSEYRVESGQTANIAVTFQPEEGREFIGQVTLGASDGAVHSVILEGSARLPIKLAPPEVRIAPPRGKEASRAASVTVSNRTERSLALKFSADRKIQPIADLNLAPAEEKTFSVVMSAEGTIPVSETIVVRGNGFSTRLPVMAESVPMPRAAATPAATLDVSGPSVAQRPSATIAPQFGVVRPAAPSPIPTASASNHLLVPVRGQWLEEGRVLELSWAHPKETVSRYRIDERFLALDGAGALQATWRALSAPKISFAGDAVVAQIAGLEPSEIHSLKVSALGADGTTLWESPLVVLGPPAKPPHGIGRWTLLLGLVLALLVVFRWRANRASP